MKRLWPLLLCFGMTHLAWAQKNSAYYLAKNIDHLVVSGPMQLVIEPEEYNDQMHVVVAPKHRAQFHVKDRTLFMHTNRYAPIHIHVAHLRSLSIHDASNVKVKDIELNHLVLPMDQFGVVHLDRVAGLRTVQHHGDSTLKLSFIQSNRLALYLGGASRTILSGVAHQMAVKSHQSARLDATFMRADDVWVDATNQSVLHLYPLQLLHAYANQNAQVLYHHNLAERELFRRTFDRANVMYNAPESIA